MCLLLHSHPTYKDKSQLLILIRRKDRLAVLQGLVENVRILRELSVAATTLTENGDFALGAQCAHRVLAGNCIELDHQHLSAIATKNKIKLYLYPHKRPKTLSIQNSLS